MKKTVHLSILLIIIVFAVGYVYGGGGHGGHGVSRPGPSSYHGSEGSGGKYSGHSYPSEGYKGYGGKSLGYNALSTGSKNYGGKSQQITKGAEDSLGEARTIEYGPGTPTEECRVFLDEMSGPRREFANKRSSHFEARENPNSNPENITRQQEEIRELFRAIERKNTQNCRWVY